MTCDFHIDLPWNFSKYGPFSLKTGNPQSAISLGRLKAGGLDSFFAALYLSDDWQDKCDSKGEVDTEINWQIYKIRDNFGCKVVTNWSEAVSAIEAGKFPIFLGLEGGRLIHRSLDRLKELHERGVRYLTLTHNRNTSWADSATDKPYHQGLTKFGKAVLEECNQLGILIDISHSSNSTAIDALDFTYKPVVATHSGCRKLVDHPRNLSDILIKAIAAKGGVIGVPFARRFIGDSYVDVARHIDHIVNLVGPNYVAIGSDLDGAQMTDGIEDVSDWKKVVMETLCDDPYRYSDHDIDLISGTNIMRVLDHA